MERFDAFCQAVCRQVRHATPRERRAIRAELTGHLEDRAEDLRQRGMPEEEAEERAVAAMGDPEAIGRELNRQYPLGWLIVSRCALVLAAVLVLHLSLIHISFTPSSRSCSIAVRAIRAGVP